MKKLLTILFLTFTTLCFGQKTIKFSDSIRKIYHIPEISYAVIDSKTIFEIAALGKHSIELSDTATINDRFHIGSNTKAMTAFIIAKYVEKEKLKWTTKFFDLFPEWRVHSKPEYLNINLQELLTHKAGIQPFQGDNDPKIPEFKGTNQEKRSQFGQFVLTLDSKKIDNKDSFFYSNAGYTLATLMVEKVTKKSWEQLVDQIFNKDLKLSVKLSWPENQKQKDTWGHSFENGKLTPIPSTVDYHLDYTEPSGDINIKLNDYIKFIQLNIEGLIGRDNYLKADTYKFIHKGIENYAMGWYNIYENNKELSTHSGTAGTYYTLVHIDRINNKAYIIFTNSFSADTQQGVRILMRKLKENYGS
ncbi:serine hydrolase domain-containing protein [Pedobacter insulae]|uniref:CubicO group peptidase, beta-lactamase class C family n=1 Tax=Pedobacter insulae TaxID=414048 RepID=A0A1I3A292_9SPHI|nr:serine hydrolase domain-containing protein [Pedobacter insulae]SFH44006.1 CubicO group peptidase, beta-lactamase class C family [Pedobacter insulae]